jgi:prevent-host-death family protein
MLYTSHQPSQQERLVSTWPVQDAKARFSELLEQSISEGPQLVTRRGEAAAVLVSMAEWNALQARAQRTLKDVLLDPAGPRMDDLQVPERGRARWKLAGFDVPA